MTPLFWIIVGCIVVSLSISYYNFHFRQKILRTIEWMRAAHSYIQQFEDFGEEAQSIHEHEIPTLELWFQSSLGFGNALMMVIGSNAAFLMFALLNEPVYILDTVAAVLNAAVIVSFIVIRKWEAQAKGMIMGTNTILDAIEIEYKQGKKVEADERN